MLIVSFPKVSMHKMAVKKTKVTPKSTIVPSKLPVIKKKSVKNVKNSSDVAPSNKDIAVKKTQSNQKKSTTGLSKTKYNSGNTGVSNANILKAPTKTSVSIELAEVLKNKTGNKDKKELTKAKAASGSAKKQVSIEAQEKIYQLKRKMHRDIFQRCLERKLLTGVESWEEPEPEIIDIIE
jgi:hypothetical protein